MTTLYNEEKEIYDLISHLYLYVDRFVIVNDGSTDETESVMRKALSDFGLEDKLTYIPIQHVGLCEFGRIEALIHVPKESWVIMLDADERFGPDVLPKIVEWINSEPEATHMYFNQMEFIDNFLTRTYQKVKVFKKMVAHLPEVIHGDPWFDGPHAGPTWTVLHRKTSDKQILREKEYIQEYKKLQEAGIIDEGKRKWFEGMHYFVRSGEEVPHG